MRVPAVYRETPRPRATTPRAFHHRVTSWCAVADVRVVGLVRRAAALTDPERPITSRVDAADEDVVRDAGIRPRQVRPRQGDLEGAVIPARRVVVVVDPLLDVVDVAAADAAWERERADRN